MVQGKLKLYVTRIQLQLSLHKHINKNQTARQHTINEEWPHFARKAMAYEFKIDGGIEMFDLAS